MVPAMFIFGDSLIDNGNNNGLTSLAKANYLPYGIDFDAGPTGRFSNGYTMVDTIGNKTKPNVYTSYVCARKMSEILVWFRCFTSTSLFFLLFKKCYTPHFGKFLILSKKLHNLLNFSTYCLMQLSSWVCLRSPRILKPRVTKCFTASTSPQLQPESLTSPEGTLYVHFHSIYATRYVHYYMLQCCN